MATTTIRCLIAHSGIGFDSPLDASITQLSATIRQAFGNHTRFGVQDVPLFHLKGVLNPEFPRLIPANRIAELIIILASPPEIDLLRKALDDGWTCGGSSLFGNVVVVNAIARNNFSMVDQAVIQLFCGKVVRTRLPGTVPDDERRHFAWDLVGLADTILDEYDALEQLKSFWVTPRGAYQPSPPPEQPLLATTPAAAVVDERDGEEPVCPIGQTSFVDPVVVFPSGVSYERAPLLEYMRRFRLEKGPGVPVLCPVGRVAIQSIAPNRALAEYAAFSRSAFSRSAFSQSSGTHLIGNALDWLQSDFVRRSAPVGLFTFWVVYVLLRAGYE